MGKIKVIQLADDLNRGGLEKIIDLITRKLDQEKYEIEIWCMARGGIVADELVNDGYVVRILGITSYLNPLNVLRLAYELRKSNATIVHAHGLFCQVIGAISGALAAVPVRIVHLHTIVDPFTQRDIFKDRVAGFFVDKVIYVSEAGYAQARRMGCGNKKKSIVIYNGVDASDRPIHPPGGKKNIFCIVASLTEHKGHRYLLRTVKQLVDRFKDINLWVVGRGPLREALEQEVKDLRIAEHVTFWGEQNDVPYFLKQSKIFALSSLREGLPVSIVEAMAQGLPVVAHRIGGTPEIVEEGVTGYLVEPKDTRQFAEKIALLLSDENRRKQMGEAARKAFEKKFTAGVMMGRIERLYDDLIRVKVRS